MTAEGRHDPGDPACVQHDPTAIYTRVLHVCVPCRSTGHDECAPDRGQA